MFHTSCSTVFVVFSASLLFHQTFAIASGQLGIQINDDVARGATKNIIFGSIATVSGLSGWTDEQIVDMAFVAHDDMKKAFKATAFASYMISKPKQPAVTTTLVIDNTAYISSSMCGGPYLYRPNGNTGANQARFTDLNPDHPCAGPVQDALTRCQLTNIVGHRTGASCGEPMAALAFCATHNEGDFSNAKIVSIIGRAETSSKIVAPCGNPDGQLTYVGEWGCHDFTTERGLNMHVIPESTGRIATDVSSDDIVISYASYP